jgi:predicted nucleic acid-binding protein
MEKRMGMIAQKCILDTNILIYHLNGVLDDDTEKLLENVLKLNSSISVITRIEVLGWQRHNPTSLQDAQDLLNRINEQPLTNEIVNECIQLRQTHSIRIPDAIIAATALHLNLPLMTRNVEDFEGIPNLRLLNPFETPACQSNP